MNTKVLILWSLLVCASAAPLVAQTTSYGSVYRKDYEKEVNGPHGECRTTWRSLDDGLEYRAITCLGGDELDLHVVRIDPKLWRLDTDVSRGVYASTLARAKSAPFVINANFFDRSRMPLGVVFTSGDEVSPLRSTSWQSIFTVDDDGKARIVLPTQWSKYRRDAWMAVQAGPRLVVGGHTASVHNTYAAARAGVCIQKSGKVLFFATPQDRKFHVTEIARVARRGENDGGLACHDAMLFDGGHSAQIFAAGSGSSTVVSIDADPVPVFVYAKPRR